MTNKNRPSLNSTIESVILSTLQSQSVQLEKKSAQLQHTLKVNLFYIPETSDLNPGVQS